MDSCPIVRVKPWGKDQGDFVEINLSDFDPDKHTVVDDEGASVVEEGPAVHDPRADAPKPAARRRKRKARK